MAAGVIISEAVMIEDVLAVGDVVVLPKEMEVDLGKKDLDEKGMEESGRKTNVN